MASSLEFVSHVYCKLCQAGVFTYKKVFGEYGFYCDGKFFACISDNQFFVKITKAGSEFMPGCPTAPPYEGGSPYFLVEELDDKDFLVQLTQITCAELPSPKPKKQLIAKSLK